MNTPAAGGQLLFSLASVAASFQNQDDLLKRALDAIVPALQADAAWIIIDALDQSGPILAAQHGLEDQEVADLFHLEFAHAAVRDILLRGGGRTLGVLSLLWRDPASDPQPEAALLAATGDLVGTALYGAQLYQTAMRVDRLQALNHITTTITASLEMPQVFEQLLETASDALNAEEAIILRFEPGTNELVFEATHTARSRLLIEQRISLGHGVTGWAAQHRQTVCINTGLDQDPRYERRFAELIKAEIHSLLCVPMFYQDTLRGVIAVVNKRQGRFTPDDARLLEEIAASAAVAIENARLFTNTRLHAHELEVLNKVSQSLSVPLNSEVIIDAGLACLADLFEAHSVLYVEMDSAGQQLTCRYIFPPFMENVLATTADAGGLFTTPVLLQGAIPSLVIEQRQTLFIADASSEPVLSAWSEWLPQLDLSSLLAAPLMAHQRVKGLLLILLPRRPSCPGDDIRLLQSTAFTLAVAVENAHLYEDLQRLVTEREQTQKQLIQSEKVSALGRLSASLAHEINNPLQAIKGCLSLFEEEMAGERDAQALDQYLRIVHAEINRIANLVRRMREFYQPSHPVGGLTNVHTVLEDILALSAKQLTVNRIALATVWMKKPPLIEVDPDHLKQIFMNLVINAIDAMPEGGALHIATQMERLPGKPGQPALCIQFRDTGTGIAPDVMARLFEPFQTTKPHGSGLGLYLSYRIIESYGGTLNVTSEVGQGTIFTIYLPIRKA